MYAFHPILYRAHRPFQDLQTGGLLVDQAAQGLVAASKYGQTIIEKFEEQKCLFHSDSDMILVVGPGTQPVSFSLTW